MHQIIILLIHRIFEYAIYFLGYFLLKECYCFFLECWVEEKTEEFKVLDVLREF
jgi:hypothetical protein